MSRLCKTKDFVNHMFDEGIFSPSEMSHKYNVMHGLKGEKAKTPEAFTKAMRRMGISAKERVALKHEGLKDKEVSDIIEYNEVQTYLGFADMQQITNAQKKRTLHYLRELWSWMSKTNPRIWQFRADVPKEMNLILCLKEHIGQDENGRWKQPAKMLQLLGAFNRCFQGILPKGWSTGLKRPAGELKDFWEFREYKEFESNLEDTREMSKEGWVALSSAHVTTGAREGRYGATGILSLEWQNINFQTRRCRIKDKGSKGKSQRWWTQVPLDIFPWLNAWKKIMRWWNQCGQPRKGRVFPISYATYLRQFHIVRRKCSTRIKEDTKTQRPHIMRLTHAQWCKRIGVTLENLCGDTTSNPYIGRYGVGWTDPKVPLRYYLTKEAWEYEEQDHKIAERLKRLNIECPLPTLEKQIYMGCVSKFPSMDNGQLEIGNVRD